MTTQAFHLTASDSGKEDDTFLAAWKSGIKLSGHPGWFGAHDDLHLQRAGSKNQLAPRIKDITRNITAIPISQACLIAAMVSFFNPAEGARMAAKVDANGLGDVARPLNHDQRIALALMLVNYRGW